MIHMHAKFTLVGGNRPPRTPMGTEPLLGSAGSGGCAKSRSRRHTHNDFTQLRAALVRKTLLLLVWLIWVLARKREMLQYTRAARVAGREWVPPSSTCAWGLLLYAQGVAHRWQRR